MSEMSGVWRSVSEAFWAICAADSMSMPVHWYYNIQDIKRDFGGWISDFSSPADRHPSSILTLSNTAGSGRTAWRTRTKRADVVGDIILHDKLDLWKSSTGSVHYHQGLQAGDNTLNVLCSLRAAQTLVAGRFADISQPEARAAVLSDYVQFLTRPGSHADTYAESFHRSFFSDWRDSRPTSPREVLVFAETRSKHMLSSPFPDSQLDAIGCLPMILPFVLLSASANEKRAVSAAVDFVKLTHPHPNVPGFVSIYSQALHAVVGGASIRQQAEVALKALGTWDTCQSFSHKAARFPECSEERLKVHQTAVNHLGLACYTRGALSSLFYLAHEFHDDIRGGILTNTNCGGENCNRGAALGALLGAGAAHARLGVPPEWKDKLRDAQEFLPNILKEVH
uniref:ADP-ribosylhydrolase like 2 n=1 Tax=Nothobranchius korthausae TaxID=1143690 RepID=A0A1A8G5E5_9TELE